MLERELPDARLVELLRFELESLENLPPADGQQDHQRVGHMLGTLEPAGDAGHVVIADERQRGEAGHKRVVSLHRPIQLEEVAVGSDALEAERGGQDGRDRAFGLGPGFDESLGAGRDRRGQRPEWPVPWRPKGRSR